MRFLRFCLVAVCLLATSVVAQEDDKSFLTRKLQDLLSGSGRTVDIVGFKGALSSEASFDRLTIADEDGIWLTLEDVVLDWKRSALLRGRLEVKSLTAARIDIPRSPIPGEEPLPDAEAKPFALPDLPVSIDLQTFSIAEVNLGAPLLGEAAQLEVQASAKFDDDVAFVDMTANRTDGKRGEFAIKADLNRAESLMDLLVKLSEDEAGLVSRLINVPGQPSVDLSIQGTGPLTDFNSDLSLSTNGEERLAGTVSLSAEEGGLLSGPPDRRIKANLGGDLTAVILPEYHDFFGPDVALVVDVVLSSDGEIDVSDFTLKAAAADLAGKIRLNADKWPSFIDINGTVARVDGQAVLLPGGGGETYLDKITLDVDYDADGGDAFKALFDISGLKTEALSIAQTQISANGTLKGDVGAVGELISLVEFTATGLVMTDAAISEAIGQEITGKANVTYAEGEPTRIADLELTGADYGLTGGAIISGLEAAFKTELDAKLQASDISRFSALAGRELDGATALELTGSVTPLSGMFDLNAKGTTQDIKTGIVQADALLAGRTDLSMAAKRDETGTFLRDLILSNPELNFTGSAALATDNSTVDATIVLRDLAAVVPQYQGSVTVIGKAIQDAGGWNVDVNTDGPYDAVLTLKGLATGPEAKIDFTAKVPDLNPLVAQVNGPLDARGTVQQTSEGWKLTTDASGPFDATASIDGLLTPLVDIDFTLAAPDVSAIAPQIEGPLRADGSLTQTATGWSIKTDASGPYDVAATVQGDLLPLVGIDFDVSLPNIKPLVPQVDGPLRASGRLDQTATGWTIKTDANGPYSAVAAVEGQILPLVEIDFDIALPNVAPLAPGIDGPLRAAGKVRQTDKGFFVDTDATGPYGARALVEGLATGPDMSLTFDVSVPNVQPIVSSVNGPLKATGTINQTPDGIAVDTNATGPFASTASVQGVVTGPNAAVDFNVDLPNLGVIVPEISGPLSVAGNARQSEQGWQIDTSADGPSGMAASVAGLVAKDGTLDLAIKGDVSLGLAAPFIAPRSLQGQAAFDLSVKGPPELGSVTGTISSSDGGFSAPNLRLALEQIATNIRLANGRADLEVSANVLGGGQLNVGGGVTLSGALPADIDVNFQDVVLSDPRLYRTSLSGAIKVAGPLAGGANISGQVDIGETNVTVPSTGLTSIGDIPQIKHIGASGEVLATLRKAGLDGADAGKDPAEPASVGPGFGLNIQVNAPSRIFVRGRGLDAELGGDLTVTGNTNNIISAGRFELLRGRLDILGKRFDLVEGAIDFQGGLVPYLRFVSSSTTDVGEVRVIVEGPADEPEITFESTPAAPEDEVLAQLLFGTNISDISAFQALQLANAVATLAGGGSQVVGNLRDSFGLDDLNVSTNSEGETELSVGKYLTEDIYTDVTASSDGTTDLSLNLDLTDNLKARATVGSDDSSSIGIFFERDY
ncbi:translocation/assembly module TamB [Sulfitobacter sp. SK012]|uniref:translocation/assembly module TamB domain-containing protein n=1 Tax=Sulfitobacter sp. SK012 TaxID=1389005 RepID=UPI000E0A675C|nr:translocation/assembly module TamB domain-containing protein [Sulfitobacter sp. SK012]AXI47333.1 translocation/assembly module TamB [Sulfitobacter sp. SK012]